MIKIAATIRITQRRAVSGQPFKAARTVRPTSVATWRTSHLLSCDVATVSGETGRSQGRHAKRASATC